MPLILDHLFILTKPAVPEARLIAESGMVEGSRNSHPGQGTANRRFFAANSTIELLYLNDVKEARFGPARGLRFADRLKMDLASPFGLVLRYSDHLVDDELPGWQYCPEYFDAELCFRVGENSDLLEEPLCIVMPPGLARPELDASMENPAWQLTRLMISVPVVSPSLPLAMVSACDGVELILNQPHWLVLEFNSGESGCEQSLMPHSPVVLRW